MYCGDPIPSTRSGFKKLWGGFAILNRESKRIHQFRQEVRDYLREVPQFQVPSKRPILISLAIGLTPKQYKKIDIDNMVKSVLDALKGVVYDNDIQVNVLHVVKYQADDDRWNIGIKQLSDDDQLWHSPWLYDESPMGQ
jgi:Holliday junction resolvase RusA-like endonuclease